MLRSLTLAALALSVITPAAFAACDISETKCALKDGKCNIKFRNVTADISGSSEGTDLTQRTSAQMIRVKALKDNGEKAGNALTIDSYASKTMNVDKKARKGFAKIRITSPALAGVDPVTMSCADVLAVLNGNGTCKVFNGYVSTNFLNHDYKLGFSCDGGKVTGPTG